MMKKAITILFTLFITFLSQAQNKDLERANKYFKRTFYTQAIPLYEKFLKNEQSIEAIKNLADSYYYTSNMNKASKNYKYLLKRYKKYVDESYYLKYANTLKALNKHKEANNILRMFYKINNPEKLVALEKEIEYLENIEALGDRFTIKSLGINTPKSEFGAIQEGNTVFFSAPKKENIYGKKFGWNGQQYLDIYTVSANKIHLGDSVTIPFSEKINTKLHESNIVFTKDGKTAYFTRNSSVKGKRKTDGKKITHVQLFKSEFIDGEWKNTTSLSFNSNEYSTEHPALSSDDRTLYFASDMPNGFGSFDIYKITILEDGSFGEPENLGKTINTAKKEQFPFISKKNKLYFSSNGHPNFGSLDIFVSTLTSGVFSKPDNVGFPVNSGYDDFSFNINSDTHEGFFASNRLGGAGSDDIYKIKEEKPLVIEACKQFISGVITDVDTEEILSNATIVLTKNGEIAQKATTDNKGKFSFTVICKSSYKVTASKTGYTTEQTIVKTDTKRNKNNDASLALKSLKVLEMEKAIAIQLLQEKEQKIKADNLVKLQLKKKERIKEVIDKEKDIVKLKDKIIYKTDEINFDYNLWYLRRDTKRAIDKVIALMKKYPDMVIEIGTHTDIRGKNKYNLKLSQKRATSVRMYFMDNGIEPDRISATGYGETQPLIKCATEEACSEEQHELNRRCEFVIKKIY